MSLKAKIEAVIYASEEPVTLAQLIGLLGEEAQAELDREEAVQQNLALDEEDADQPLISDEVGGAEIEAEADAGETALDAEQPEGEAAEPGSAELPQIPADSAAWAGAEAADVEADESAANPGQLNVSEQEGPVGDGERGGEDGSSGEQGVALDTEPTDEEGAPSEAVGADGDAAEQAIESGDFELQDEGASQASSESTALQEPSEPQDEPIGETDPAAAAKAEKARAARLKQYFRSVLDKLIAEYADAESERGLEIREVGGGFRFATKPEYHDAVRGFVKSLKPPLKLSLQALETLAVVAYKQPVTAPEVSEIRGVDSAGVLGSLIGRKLVTTAGRKQVIGRPILYKTTKDFLLKFGLKDLSELPSIEEFEKMAGQMAEQEEIPMPEPREQERHTVRDVANPGGSGTSPDEVAEMVERQRNTHESQADGYSGAAENISEETADKASVDGRISSLPPDYAGEELSENPSAQDAEAQRGE